tara:strand:- start:590 stop:730 length:141 start_codon:yes stop_codon:yes gene_type:complete
VIIKQEENEGLLKNDIIIKNGNEKHELNENWTFWYVYTLSHNEKKK